MTMFLDHVFIITEPGAPASQRLSAIGLCEGNSNTHPGQGTSNRRFFLENFTIELLFVNDSVEAATGAGKRLGILTRSRDMNASPFGIVARVVDVDTTPDFPSWKYFPDYFPGDMCFYVGENSNLLQEPLCICMPPSLPKAKTVPDQYANSGWQLTELILQLPVSGQSTTLRQFAAIDNIIVRTGNSHQMTMRFNHGMANRSESFMPDLPLVIEW